MNVKEMWDAKSINKLYEKYDDSTSMSTKGLTLNEVALFTEWFDCEIEDGVLRVTPLKKINKNFNF